MDATTSKATVLAKMIGFYTIEIRNLETGAVQSRSDLLVMENLFYDQKVAKTFDLKGIQGRKVKPSGGIKAPHTSKTLFDGEWIEGYLLMSLDMFSLLISSLCRPTKDAHVSSSTLETGASSSYQERC